MNAPVRTFETRPAVREAVPLLIGLTGPSGGGKTFSALRLAKGIQSVSGGEIYAIDTEARRMLHYADRFRKPDGSPGYQYMEFGAPFGSLDYLAAIRQAVAKGAGVIIVDSMSHEHEGPGGMIDAHEKELDRLAGDDWSKRERVKMLAWQKPKAARRALINGILQLNANFVFCFRAKNTAKPVKQNGKTEVVPQGFMPIAGEELVFEMTVNCLLLPHADGVPTWQSENVGERMMMKLPDQFRDLFAEQRPLSEEIGAELARWARGAAPTGASASGETTEAAQAAARVAAAKGKDALQAHWKSLDQATRRLVNPIMADLKTTAAKVTAPPADEMPDDPFADEPRAPAPATSADTNEGGQASETEASGNEAAGEGSASPANPAADPPRGLSAANVEVLEAFAAALSEANTPAAVEKVRDRFFRDRAIQKGSTVPFAAAARIIADAHLARAGGEPDADVDAAVRKALAL